MRTMTRRSWFAGAAGVALAVSLGCVGLAGCASTGGDAQTNGDEAKQQSQPATRTVTDMAGRTVDVPADVKSIATFGSVGVLNAFVECMGKGNLIVNEMPANFTKNDK